MHIFSRLLFVILISSCSSDTSKVECSKVDTQMATVLIDCNPEALRSDCINQNIYNLIRTEDFKKNTLIRFNDSEDDAEIKDFLTTLYPEEDKGNSKFMTLNALDVAFKKDRELGNIYIYKILDLMDRNYDINNLSKEISIKLTAQAKKICKNN